MPPTTAKYRVQSLCIQQHLQRWRSGETYSLSNSQGWLRAQPGAVVLHASRKGRETAVEIGWVIRDACSLWQDVGLLMHLGSVVGCRTGEHLQQLTGHTRSQGGFAVTELLCAPMRYACRVPDEDLSGYNDVSVSIRTSDSKMTARKDREEKIEMGI